MTTASQAQAASVPGRLVANPTNLGTSFPYGGTALGAIVDPVLLPGYRYSEVPSTQFGGGPTDVLYLGGTWRFLCKLRGLDADAVAAIFPNYSTVSSGKVLTHPGSVPAGTLLASSSIKLLFAADDSTYESTLIYRAICYLDPKAEIRGGHDRPRDIAVGFVAIPPSSGTAIGQVGTLARLTV